MHPAGINEPVHPQCIDHMNKFIHDHGIRAFSAAVYHGAFAEVAYAYIHPHEETRSSENFEEIQKAFLNAY